MNEMLVLPCVKISIYHYIGHINFRDDVKSSLNHIMFHVKDSIIDVYLENTEKIRRIIPRYVQQVKNFLPAQSPQATDIGVHFRGVCIFGEKIFKGTTMEFVFR